MFGNRPWNIAIVVGARARVFVFDLDRHAQGEDGIEAFQELCSELGIEQPDPVTSITGGGGLQLFFRHPGPEYHIGSRCGDNALRPGLEVKGDDSYVIVPPSLHRSGRRYAWQERADGAKSKILDCPPELLRLVVTGPRRARTIATGHAATSFLGRAFAAAHMLGPDLPESKAAVTCPWEHEHSDGKGSLSSTALLPPTINHPLGLFRCQHQHCARRGNVAVMQALPDEALAEAGLMDPQGFALAMNILAARAA